MHGLRGFTGPTGPPVGDIILEASGNLFQVDEDTQAERLEVDTEFLLNVTPRDDLPSDETHFNPTLVFVSFNILRCSANTTVIVSLRDWSQEIVIQQEVAEGGRPKHVQFCYSYQGVSVLPRAQDVVINPVPDSEILLGSLSVTYLEILPSPL